MSAAWLSASFLAGVLITWVVRNVSPKLGMVAHPGTIVPQHREPVAYTGGIAIALTVLLVTLAAHATGANDGALLVSARVWIPAALFLLIGVIDDLRPLHPVVKLVLQTSAAITAVGLGLRWHVASIEMVNIAVSISWFVLLVNAFNVTDVCDGLVGGLAVIMLTFAGVHVSESWLSLVTIGAVLGFLVFNRPPASIFLGDGGSLLLGFVVGASLLTVTPATAPAPWKYAAAAAICSGVVLLEVALLVYSRTKAGIPWWRGSPHHFSLRLQARGLSRLTTDVVAWTAAVALCGVAWFLPRIPDLVAITVTLAVTLALIAVGRLLLRWDAHR